MNTSYTLDSLMAEYLVAYDAKTELLIGPLKADYKALNKHDLPLNTLLHIHHFNIENTKIVIEANIYFHLYQNQVLKAKGKNKTKGSTLKSVTSDMTFNDFISNYKCGKNRFIVDYGKPTMRTITVAEQYNYNGIKEETEKMKQQIKVNKENLSLMQLIGI